MRYSRKYHARQAQDHDRSYCDVHHVWFNAVAIKDGKRMYLRCHRCVEDQQRTLKDRIEASNG